jgi:hypothetical protein
VKNVWLHEILWGITAINELGVAVRTSHSKSNLPFTAHQEEILLEIERFGSNFFKHFDIEKGHGGNPLPQANRPIDPTDANRVSTELQKLQWKASALINDSIEILNKKYKNRSILYRIAYTIGGLLFVFAKLLDWHEFSHGESVVGTLMQAETVAQPLNRPRRKRRTD